MLDHPLFGFIAGLPLWYVIVGLLEYWSHVLFMHNKRGGPIYHHHHQLHHGEEVNWPFYIDLPVWQHIFIGAPLWIPMVYIGLYFSNRAWGTLAAFALVICWHSYFWTKLHRAFHGVEENWTMRLPRYNEYLTQHLDHHRRVGTNYGVLYLWTDKLFGTHWRSGSENE